MTVESLDTVKKIIEEANGLVEVVYKYNHAITEKELYSIENHITRGNTLRSGYCLNPRIVYDKDEGWLE